jgi:multidrug efflux system outer membrane protein
MQKLLTLLISLVWALMTNAQAPPLLTLEDCILRAGQNSYRLQTDDYKIAAGEHVASLAKSTAIPKIGGDLATENRFLRPYYFNQVWASVHADWSLGDFLQKTGRSSAQDVETRRLEKEQNRLDVIGRSTSLYMSILQVKKQIELLRARLQFLQQHQMLTQGMWKAGVRTQLDVLQTESEIIKLQEDTARLAIIRKNLRNEMALLLGWNNTDSLRLASVRVDSITAMPAPEVSIESLAGNPILASYDSKVKAQQFRTEEIIASQIPHILLGGGYFVDGDPTADGNFWQINAGITIPIYYGHESDIKKQVSKAIVESLDAQKLEVARELMIHLVKVHEKLVKLKDLLELQSQRQAITSQAVGFAEINYKAGISTNLDYLSAQQRLTNTQLAIEETRLEYTMNLVEYYIITNQVDKIIALGKN